MRAAPFDHDDDGSGETVSKVAPAAELLPFRPPVSWYDAYWYHERILLGGQPTRSRRWWRPLISRPRS